MKVPAERLHEIVRGNFCDIAELRAMAAELIEVRKLLVESQITEATLADLLRRWVDRGLSEIVGPGSRPNEETKRLLIDSRVAVGR